MNCFSCFKAQNPDHDTVGKVEEEDHDTLGKVEEKDYDTVGKVEEEDHDTVKRAAEEEHDTVAKVAEEDHDTVGKVERELGLVKKKTDIDISTEVKSNTMRHEMTKAPESGQDQGTQELLAEKSENHLGQRDDEIANMKDKIGYLEKIRAQLEEEKEKVEKKVASGGSGASFVAGKLLSLDLTRTEGKISRVEMQLGKFRNELNGYMTGAGLFETGVCAHFNDVVYGNK